MHIQRFFSYLSAFTAGMLLLICGGNFLVMFVGWEAIGVVSYLLINFYFTRLQSNKAAILAFTMNRGGAAWSRISQLCQKLSNSGDALKLFILNYIWKYISGWSNYSGIVTSKKMSENKMGYRGSKSGAGFARPVKEQRVDGSYFINLCFCLWKISKGKRQKSKLMKLRCTLMGCENSYQIKIPSKQLKIKKFSTINYDKNRSKAWFWTGLIDAEGSFSIIIDKTNKRKLGWRVQSKFQLGLHERDLSLILELKQFLGDIGSIQFNSARNVVNYSIDSNKELIKLIKHLDNYPLFFYSYYYNNFCLCLSKDKSKGKNKKTQKAADFILFKEVVMLINEKAHLTIEGLHQIINIKASMNLGLSEFLKYEFKNFKSVQRPNINTNIIPDHYWIAGSFGVTGDGCFDVNVTQSTNKIGYRVQLRFRIIQHDRDLELMECIIKYLGTGQIYKYSKTQAISLIVYNFSDIINIIIPFFDKNPLLGTKSLDYQDWSKIANLMKDGSHLTIEGLNQIKNIKSGMNTGRKF